jgi:hypothetical protein
MSCKITLMCFPPSSSLWLLENQGIMITLPLVSLSRSILCRSSPGPDYWRVGEIYAFTHAYTYWGGTGSTGLHCSCPCFFSCSQKFFLSSPYTYTTTLQPGVLKCERFMAGSDFPSPHSHSRNKTWDYGLLVSPPGCISINKWSVANPNLH